MKKSFLALLILSSTLVMSACDKKVETEEPKVKTEQVAETPKIAGLSVEDGKTIEAELVKLGDSFKVDKWDLSIKVMPPALIENLAKQANMPKEELEKALTDMVASLGQAAKVQTYSYQLDKSIAEKSKDGRDYVFIPNQLKANMQGQDIVSNGYLLAIKDAGKWYFINWDQQYAPIVKQTYPDLADIQAPAKSAK